MAKKNRKSREKIWMIIGVIVPIIALIVYLVFELKSAKIEAASLSNDYKRLSIELSSPVIEINTFYHIGQRDDIEETKLLLRDQFLTLLIDLSESNPDTPYTELINEIVPISMAISPVPIEINIPIINTGKSQATDVIVYVKWIGTISNINVTSIAKWKLIEGGFGESFVKISIDRISIDETIDVNLKFNSTSTNMDILVLDNSYVLSLSNILLDSNNEQVILGNLPSFHIEHDDYEPQYQSLFVQISSNETPVLFSSITVPFENLVIYNSIGVYSQKIIVTLEP